MDAGDPRSGHAYAMGLSEILELSRPPDPEIVDLIQQAFLDGQIDGLKADLAPFSLRQHE